MVSLSYYDYMESHGHDAPRGVRPPGAPSAAYLLVTLGFHAARELERRLDPLGIEPRHFGLLRLIAATEGQSQQSLGDMLQIPKSRMVWLVDDLEQLGLVERRRNPSDRRANALFLTSKGHATLEAATSTASTHEEALLASLDTDQRRQLASLLSVVAAEQGVLDSPLPGQPPGRRGSAEDR
jgi:DNA-binding MarR family transcriptional regulator